MIIGHQKQWEFLKTAFFEGNLSHAYLFFGPSQIGKKTLALEFAKLINCEEESPKKKPCQHCRSCGMFDRLIHPDFIFVGPPLGKREIQIAQIRDLSAKISLKPFIATYKVAIIDEAHLMNAEAQNCFLKTLEEPKGEVVIILISDHREALLETVLSRVQEVRFSFVPEKEIEEFLQRDVDKKEREKILRFSSGCPGKAINLSQESSGCKKKEKLEKELTDILEGDLRIRFERAEFLAKNYSAEILETWLRYLREKMFEVMEGGGEKLTAVRENIKAVEKAIFLISFSGANKRLVLENLMLELAD